MPIVLELLIFERNGEQKRVNTRTLLEGEAWGTRHQNPYDSWDAKLGSSSLGRISRDPLGLSSFKLDCCAAIDDRRAEPRTSRVGILRRSLVGSLFLTQETQ